MNIKAFEPGDVIIGTSDETSPIQDPHRVLEILPHLDLVTLIPIPTGPRKTKENKQASYYAKGFVSKKLSHLEFWLETKLIIITTLDLPAHWYLSDTDLRLLSPPKDDQRVSIEDQHRSPLEIKRNFKWKLIEPLISIGSRSAEIRPLEFTEIEARVRARAKEAGVSAGQVYDALHRYYAYGCIKNALLPNNIAKSGAPGKPRRGKNGVKLGRKNAATKAGDTALSGLILGETDIQNIEDAYTAFVQPGATIKQAFLSMSSTYYSTGHTLKHGYLVPNLLDAHQRPTESEFRYHGPLGKDSVGAARRLMGEGNWARNYRSLCGSVRDGITTIGLTGSLDASPIDVNLVACNNPLQPIGVGKGLFVRDAWLGLYVGWNISIGGLGTNEAKLAILRAATNKSKLLERHNLDLPSEDFPSLFFSRYLSDNGELRSCDGIKSIVDDLTSRIEFVASGRADLNSVSESGHHARHRGFDHHIEGTTKGRSAKRGEPLAITKALISKFAYERLLILWIHWINTKQELPLHLIPTEMQREFSAQGKTLNRTRIGIYRWANENGYVSGTRVNPDYLRAHLLPRFTASVQRGGLILHRPNTGNAVELLHGARFNHEYLAQTDIIRDAMRSGKKHIEVCADPDDLSQIILIDKHGPHFIPNIKDDLIFIQEAGIPDLCAINDAEKLNNINVASQRDQDLTDQQSFRKEEQSDAREKKKIAKDALGNGKMPSTKRAGVREAQATEKRNHLDEQVSCGTARKESKGAPHQDLNMKPSQIEIHPVPSKKYSTLIDIRKKRLSNFNSERKV